MMNKKFVLRSTWATVLTITAVGTFMACTNEEDDLDACNCNFYPELNQYLPESLTADDVIGEDTYYSGEELREMNRRCLDFCQ